MTQTTASTGKPFKVTGTLNGRPINTSHTSRRHAETKVGRLIAAGATNVNIRWYEAARGTITVICEPVSLGWTGVEIEGSPWEWALARAMGR